MIEYLNLFPESRYLRVRRTPELDHKCGGIASLAILVVLFVIMILKLVEAFSKITVISNFKQTVDFQPPMTAISTYQNDPYQSPYMMAVAFQNRGCSNASRTLNVWYITYHLNGSFLNQYETKQKIAMEPCTAAHFSNIPQIKQNAESLGIANWQCLPIDKNINIGGRLDISNETTSIQVEIICDVTCPVDYCGSTMVYQINSLINPNVEEPFEYYLTRNDLDISANTFNYYKIFLDQNILETDHSLFPFENITRKGSISSQPMEHRASIDYNSKKQTYLYIERSSLTKTVSRKYLKLMDVMAYVGGIFPALFGIFFFMKGFGMYFFQMTFAYQHFKCKETKYNTFGQFLKKTIYQTLNGAGKAPSNWKIAKMQCQINSLVNKMLDINYLYKRIQFLQSGLSVLLDDHQLKGVYLSQVTLGKADKQYNAHKLRDRVIKYLEKANTRKKEKMQTANRLRQISTKQPDSPLKKRLRKKPARMLSQITEEIDSHDIKMESRQQMWPDPVGIKRFNSKLEGLKVQDSISLKERNHMLLSRESEMIDPLKPQQLNQEQLQFELESDLKKLFREARRKRGDPVCKRIVGNIDEWLRSELEDAIEEYQYDNPRFDFRLINTSKRSD